MKYLAQRGEASAKKGGEWRRIHDVLFYEVQSAGQRDELLRHRVVSLHGRVSAGVCAGIKERAGSIAGFEGPVEVIAPRRVERGVEYGLVSQVRSRVT